MSFQFTCPDCRTNALVEIITDATITRPITKVDESGVEYGERSDYFSMVDRYQCANCGYVLAGVTNAQELIEFLKIKDTFTAKEMLAVEYDGQTVLNNSDLQDHASYAAAEILVNNWEDALKSGCKLKDLVEDIEDTVYLLRRWRKALLKLPNSGEEKDPSFGTPLQAYSFLVNTETCKNPDSIELFAEAETIVAEDARLSYEYAVSIGQRFPQGEEAIARLPDYACWYARDIIKGRWLQGEEVIARSAKWSYIYALVVLKDRFVEGEATLATHPEWACMYAKDILEGRFLEAEQALLKDPVWGVCYADMIKKTEGEKNE